MKDKNNLILMAEQQFAGFVQGKNSGDVLGLIISMGLKKNEWEIIKKDYSITNSFSKSDFQEIEEYFKEEK